MVAYADGVARDPGLVRETGIIVSQAVVAADRREDWRAVINIAGARTLHRYAVHVCLTAVQVGAAVHPANGIRDTRTAARGTGAEAGDLDLGLCCKALVDVGVSIDATDGVVLLTAFPLAGDELVFVGRLPGGFLFVGRLVGVICFAGVLAVGRGGAFALGHNLDARHVCDAFVTVGLAVGSTDRGVIHRAGHFVCLRKQ